MILGISGRIGSGKDTVGKIIQDLTKNSYGQSPWQIRKFAYKLKQIVSLLTSIPVEDLEKQEVKDRVLGEEWNHGFTGGKYTHPINGGTFTYTVRELLQIIGTEAMRNNLHENVWVNALMSDYKAVQTGWPPYDEVYPQWIITDVRFTNEAQAIKDKGGIMLRVNRGELTPGHISETALDDYPFDEVIYNSGTIEDLTEKVKTFLIRHEI